MRTREASVDHEERPRKRRQHAADRNEFGFMRRSPGQGTANFIGSASGIHFVRSVYNAAQNKAAASETPGAAPGDNAVPGEEDHLATTAGQTNIASLWRTSEISATARVTYDAMLSWSESYWDYWHPALPFLHAPTVLQLFHEIAALELNAIDSQLPDYKLATVRSIFSISLADRRQCFNGSSESPCIPGALVFSSVDAAVQVIHAQLLKQPTIATLQATFAVQLFLVSMLHHNAASRIGGLIIRMVQQLGIHRCPVRFATFSEEDVMIRKRVFWSIYLIDRHISHSLGLPLV